MSLSIFVFFLLSVISSANGSSLISLYLNNTKNVDQNPKYLSSYDTVSSNLDILTILPNTFAGSVISGKYDSVNQIYGVAIKGNTSYSMGYISLASSPPSIHLVTIPSGYVLLGHEFRPAYDDSMVLLAISGVYPAVGICFSISMETFIMLPNLSISSLSYLTNSPLHYDASSNSIFIYTLLTPGHFGILRFSLSLGSLLTTLTFSSPPSFSSSFLCESMGIANGSLYCLSGQQLVSINTMTSIATQVAESWCNCNGKACGYYEDNLAFDYTFNTAYSLWTSCGGVPTLFAINLTTGAVTSSTNSELAFLNGIQVA